MSDSVAPEPAAPVAAPIVQAAALVVEVPASPEQVARAAFVDQVRAEVAAAAGAELDGTGWTVEGCPWVRLTLAWVGLQSAATIEAAVRRTVANAGAVTRGADYLPLIRAHTTAAVRYWRQTGRITGVPVDARSIPGLPVVDENPPPIQRAALPGAGPGELGGDPRAVAASLGPGRPLEGGVRTRMERGLGVDLGAVRTHTHAHAAALSERLGARAFTVGQHVAFGRAAFQPGTIAGDALLAHELAHTVQQRGGGAARVSPAGGGGETSLEHGADTAAQAAVLRLHGVALPAPAIRGAPGGLHLQRCNAPSSTPAGPAPLTDPFALELQALLNRTPPDKAGFFRRLVDQAGAKAGNTPLREALLRFQTDGKLTVAETFRARLVQELGPDGHTDTTRWPTPVRNFADGVDDGIYTITLTDVPASAEGIRQLCIERATSMAHGSDLASTYRARFNARWDHPDFRTAGSPRHARRSTAFDPTLSSKGPKNPRARAIFEELYADAAIRAAYDGDSPAGFRELCDTYAVPAGLNLAASPRIQALLTALAGAPLAPAPTAVTDVSYTTFVGTLATPIAGLDADDQDQIRQQASSWRAVFERKLGTTDTTIVSDLQGRILGASPAAPRARNPLSLAPTPVAPPTTGSPTPATPGAPAPPTPAERTFLGGIHITPPAGPIDVEAASERVTFPVHAAAPNPSLVVQRRVEVGPAAQVRGGTHEDQREWALGVQDLDHEAILDPRTTAASGETRFTATLTMPPYSPAHFPAQTTAPVVIRDKRRTAFRRDVEKGLFFFYTEEHGLATVPTPTYLGGQLPILVQPYLPGGTPNPDLPIRVRGEVRKGATAVPGGTFAEVPWQSGRPFAELGRVNLVQTSATATGQDTYSVKVEFLDGPGGAVFHTVGPTNFQVNRAALRATPAASDAAQLATDRTTLRTAPAAAPPADPAHPPTLRDYLKYPPPSLNAAQRANCQRVEAAIAAGRVIIDSMIVRSDSAHLIPTAPAAWGVTTHQHVVYALGSMVISGPTILVTLPGYVGWHPHGSPTIYLNLTPDTSTPGRQRPLSELAELAAHEAVHAMDPMPAPGGITPWHSYSAEFRAYWTDGRFDGESTEPDTSITWGPPTPRANAIFRMIYYGYEHTRTAYEADAAFRQRVDQYLYPDALNLPVSVTLDDLRLEIGNHAPAYATRKTNVQAKFNACSPAEQAEVGRQRAWRDLVEQHFTGIAPTATGGTEPEALQIKRLLGIPT